MSQNDFSLANQGFPQMRADMNSALQALASNSSGATAPGTTYAYQFWYDTATNLLKMRNADNNDWITLAAFDQTTDEWEIRSAVIQAVDSAGVVIKTDEGTTRVTVADNGNVTLANDLVVTGTVQASNISATGSMAARNKIINGAMVIDQRNAGAAVTPTNGQFSVDRWKGQLSQASKYTMQQNAGAVTPPAGFTNYLGITSLSSYSVGASDFFDVRQVIEGFNIADLAWGASDAKPITLSFWVRSSLTGTFGAALKNFDSTRSYPFTYAIGAANTWEYKTVTIAGDTSGTWETTNGFGIQIQFGLGVGSTFSGTAGAWASANLISVTGAVSVVATNAATWQITGVQLEAGDTATPFEHRSYGQELALCQRYFEKASVAAVTTVSSIAQSYSWKTEKRATPTLQFTPSSGSGASFIPQSTSGCFQATNHTAWITGVLTASAEL